MSPYSWGGGGGGNVWRTNNSSPWLPICSPACLPVCLLLCLSAFLSFNRTSDASFSGRLPPKEERCLKPMLGVCLYVCPSHTHTHTRTRAHTHTHIHRHTHSCTLTHTHRRTHARTRTHAHRLTRTLTRAHTHIHTHCTVNVCLRLTDFSGFSLSLAASTSDRPGSEEYIHELIGNRVSNFKSRTFVEKKIMD